MMTIRTGGAAGQREWNAIAQDANVFSICVILQDSAAAHALAARAERAPNGGWRRVVQIVPSDVPSVAERSAWFAAQPQALAAFLSKSRPRHAVAWCFDGDLEYECDQAFLTAEKS